MTMMNQSQYAQHSGVDRKTIGRWIKAGRFIVMDGDLIDVEASDAALKRNRDGKDPRASNAKKKKTPAVVDDVGDELEDTARKIILTEGADLTREEAARLQKQSSGASTEGLTRWMELFMRSEGDMKWMAVLNETS